MDVARRRGSRPPEKEWIRIVETPHFLALSVNRKLESLDFTVPRLSPNYFTLILLNCVMVS